jgi:septin family protein
MSRLIDRLVTELTDDGMLEVKKMKKSDLQLVVKQLISDNLRELDDDTIVSIYEQKFNTHLVKY